MAKRNLGDPFSDIQICVEGECIKPNATIYEAHTGYDIKQIIIKEMNLKVPYLYIKDCDLTVELSDGEELCKRMADGDIIYGYFERLEEDTSSSSSSSDDNAKGKQYKGIKIDLDGRTTVMKAPLYQKCTGEELFRIILKECNEKVSQVVVKSSGKTIKQADKLQNVLKDNDTVIVKPAAKPAQSFGGKKELISQPKKEKGPVPYQNLLVVIKGNEKYLKGQLFPEQTGADLIAMVEQERGVKVAQIRVKSTKSIVKRKEFLSEFLDDDLTLIVSLPVDTIPPVEPFKRVKLEISGKQRTLKTPLTPDQTGADLISAIEDEVGIIVAQVTVKKVKTVIKKKDFLSQHLDDEILLLVTEEEESENEKIIIKEEKQKGSNQMLLKDVKGSPIVEEEEEQPYKKLKVEVNGKEKLLFTKFYPSQTGEELLDAIQDEIHQEVKQLRVKSTGMVIKMNDKLQKYLDDNIVLIAQTDTPQKHYKGLSVSYKGKSHSLGGRVYDNQTGEDLMQLIRSEIHPGITQIKLKSTGQVIMLREQLANCLDDNCVIVATSQQEEETSRGYTSAPPPTQGSSTFFLITLHTISIICCILSLFTWFTELVPMFLICFMFTTYVEEDMCRKLLLMLDFVITLLVFIFWAIIVFTIIVGTFGLGFPFIILLIPYYIVLTGLGKQLCSPPAAVHVYMK